MASVTPLPPRRPTVAQVDFLVDENGERLEVRDDSSVAATGKVEQSVGSTSPANWWRTGLIALGVVVFILLVLQFFNGSPGTDVQPGTPVAAPEAQVPQLDPPATPQ